MNPVSREPSNKYLIVLMDDARFIAIHCGLSIHRDVDSTGRNAENRESIAI